MVGLSEPVMQKVDPHTGMKSSIRLAWMSGVALGSNWKEYSAALFLPCRGLPVHKRATRALCIRFWSRGNRIRSCHDIIAFGAAI